MDKESTRKIVQDEKNLYGAADKSSEQQFRNYLCYVKIWSLQQAAR